MRLRLFLTALMVGIVAGLVSGPVASAGGPPYNMYTWMQPPVGTLNVLVCLTNRWHPSAYGDPTHSLDFKRTCGSGVSETAWYRSRNAAPDDGAGDFIAAQGEPSQRPNISCDSQTLRYAWVRVRGQFDALQKGIVIYQHISVSSTATFDIYFRGAGSFDNAYFNSKPIGATTDDGPSNEDCWEAFHVHENNSAVGSGSYWDSWNAYYTTASTGCQCIDNDFKHRWTRRLHWADS